MRGPEPEVPPEETTLEEISVTNLVKRYENRTTILNGVSFSVSSGEFVTIHGMSGCGKTTLLNLLGGLDRPTSGEILIDGEDITKLSEDELARLRLEKVGFVFQDYNLLDDLTVRENIRLPLRFSKRTVKRGVDDLIKKFSIEHIADEMPNRISGGESQRVAIARAMVNEPKIILADEPTGNLDTDNAAKVMEAFHLINREFRATIILATHDIALARHATRNLSILPGGAIKEAGRTRGT